MLNQKKIAQAMKRMGVSQKELPVKKVIFETEDANFIFENPQVSQVNMMGQETYQIVGDFTTKQKQNYNQEDIKIIMEQCNVSEEQAKKSLQKNNGEIAKAIIDLKNA